MSVGIRRGAPIVAAVLSLTGVVVAAALEPDTGPRCPSGSTSVLVLPSNTGIIAKMSCNPADESKGSGN